MLKRFVFLVDNLKKYVKCINVTQLKNRFNMSCITRQFRLNILIIVNVKIHIIIIIDARHEIIKNKYEKSNSNFKSVNLY